MTSALTPLVASAAVPNLKGAAARGGRLFGAAVRSDQLAAHPALLREVLAQCSALTPEIHLFWNSIENKRGQIWFEPVDALVDLAAEHGLQLHGHPLIWEQSTPDWALRDIRKKKDWRLVEAHFERLLTRYRDVIPSWNVVNEPIDTEGGKDNLRRTSFFKAFGPGYIARALETARRYAPAAHLSINEYSLEYDNPVDADRRAAFLKLVATLKRDGVPLDGVGIQAHLDLGKGPLRRDIIAPFLERIADLGLDIAITELDVKERDYRATHDTRDSRVADEVRRFLDIVLEQPAVTSVTTWGVSDRHSWLKVEPGDRRDDRKYGKPAPNRGLPYDKDFAAKPMYWALADSFAAQPNFG